MKKNRLNILLFTIISFILFINFINCDWGSSYGKLEITFNNHPSAEIFSIDYPVIEICFGNRLTSSGFDIYGGECFYLKKITDDKIYGIGHTEWLDSNLFPFQYFFKIGDVIDSKIRISKDKILFNKMNSTFATWNEDDSISIGNDDIKFFDKSFWNWYLRGVFKIDITNIDASLPFFSTFRLLFSDNNNIDNTSKHTIDCTNGQFNSYGDYIKVGEDYEPSAFYVKMEEYNSVSEQYELTKISKERIIIFLDEINKYNTIVDWNSGSPNITEDDFKLFDDTAWNVVE